MDKEAVVYMDQVCRLCGWRDVRHLYAAEDRLSNSYQKFPVSLCNSCGVIQTLPEMNDEELALYYPEHYWGEHNEPTQSWINSSQEEKVRFLERCKLREGTILDVGCGAGFFLRALDGSKWSHYGVEISPEAVKSAARHLGKDHIVVGTLPDLNFKPHMFDVITFWSSLEHMNNPKENLLKAKELIKVGGSIVVQVPNIGSYQAKLFNEDWFALDVPRHRYHFTLETLSKLLIETGFKPYQKTFYSKTHNSHALRQSLKRRLKRSGKYTNLLLFYLAVPFIKPFDRIMTALNEGATITLAARAE
jgi:2-polyprenyl-3-methyl-5-hydroxy-6-metoxy-1,4-benzoquinol methylase